MCYLDNDKVSSSLNKFAFLIDGFKGYYKHIKYYFSLTSNKL